MSSLAGLKKELFNFPQKYRFWPFLTTWSTFKVDFLNVQAKFRKILHQFPGGRCYEHFAKFSAFYLQKGAGG